MAVTPRSASAATGSKRAAKSKTASAPAAAPKAAAPKAAGPKTAGSRTTTGLKSAARSGTLGADLGLSTDDLLEMYRLVALARAVDERMWILNRAGRIPFVISGQGHEGAQVGVTWALEKGKDWIAPFYRSIATCLTFGMSPRDIMTAQYATASDPSSGGRQMPGHYGSHAHNLVSVSSPVATQLLHAVGLALAAKIRKTGQVALTIMGEGSSNQGDVHEGLNFAAIHKLPFIFIVENNGYAISVPLARQVAGSSVAGRAAGYGIPGTTVDGSDVLACYAAAREAVDRARAGDGPSLIECKVTRLTGHSSDDQQTKYRTEEELAADRSLDPVPKFREQLVKAGILTPDAEATIEASIKDAVHDATEYAESQPDPQPSTAMRWVYAEDWPSEVPPAWGLGEGSGDGSGQTDEASGSTDQESGPIAESAR